MTSTFTDGTDGYGGKPASPGFPGCGGGSGVLRVIFVLQLNDLPSKVSLLLCIKYGGIQALTDSYSPV